MDQIVSRRDFLAAAGAGVGLAAAGASLGQVGQVRQEPRRIEVAGPLARPAVIASGNGREAARLAYEMLLAGADPLEAAVSGVALVEDDPEDSSVGLGGLPNEDGVVELDASVMHGPTHRAAGVASLRNIRNPARVALEVARRTDHVLIVGEGALRFAKRVGFQEENLLTDKSREAWLRWRSTLSREDDWLQEDEWDLPPDARTGRRAALEVPHTTGTVHCSALTAAGDLAGTTSTSGLSWKLPGRVGDSPIIGAGLYTDNAVGSAGATGRGEAVLQVCGARTAVMRMEMGDSPEDACLYVLQMIADRTRFKRLQDDRGRPNFNVTMYAIRKDGAFGSAAMLPGATYAVCDAQGARVAPSRALFE